MADDWHIDLSAGRPAAYRELHRSILALIDGETSRMANLANVAAALFSSFGWHWVGFYLVDSEAEELVLGPFQGPVACTRLRKGKGVCAAAWSRQELVNVPDVEAFPGHVACSQFTRSELVIPIVVEGEVMGVLDIDSIEPADFDDADEAGLAAVVRAIESHWSYWK